MGRHWRYSVIDLIAHCLLLLVSPVRFAGVVRVLQQASHMPVKCFAESAVVPAIALMGPLN
jgi:hypothetical protein